jgi:hypothetical protein
MISAIGRYTDFYGEDDADTLRAACRLEHRWEA